MTCAVRLGAALHCAAYLGVIAAHDGSSSSHIAFTPVLRPQQRLFHAATAANGTGYNGVTAAVFDDSGSFLPESQLGKPLLADTAPQQLELISENSGMRAGVQWGSGRRRRNVFHAMRKRFHQARQRVVTHLKNAGAAAASRFKKTISSWKTRVAHAGHRIARLRAAMKMRAQRLKEAAKKFVQERIVNKIKQSKLFRAVQAAKKAYKGEVHLLHAVVGSSTKELHVLKSVQKNFSENLIGDVISGNLEPEVALQSLTQHIMTGIKNFKDAETQVLKSEQQK